MTILLLIGSIALLIFLLNSQEKLKGEIKRLKERLARLESSPPMPAPIVARPPTVSVEPKPERPPYTPARVEVPRSPEIQRPPRPPAPPSPPNPVVLAVQRFFTGGNLVVRIGVIVLFFGVAFLLKLAIDHGLIPIEVRLAGVAVAAIALMAAGWRLRAKRTGYALSLIGGAVGILYLDVFAALRIYHLMPAMVAFGLLLFIVAFSSAIAILLRSQAIAVLGVCGGFLAPIVTSTGGGSHVQLFSYFLVLNLGILGIAWFRAWRFLNVLGFFFTFSLGLSWGAMYYQPAHFRSTEPFLILFFLFYSIIPLLFAAKIQTSKTYEKGFVDTTLAFGTPLVGFGLQAALVKDMPHGLAWSSLVLAAYYLTIAWFLFKKAPAAFRALTEVFLAIGVVFVTLTIPLRLDHQWTCLSWALEGSALVWVGVRQKRLLARLFGVFVLFAAGFAFRGPVEAERGLIVLNPYLLGALFVSLGAFFSSYYLARDPERTSQPERALLAPALFLWALGWWFYGGSAEIVARLSGPEQEVLRFHGVLFFIVASLGVFEVLQRRLSWPLLRIPVFGLLPVLVGGLLYEWGLFHYHPTQALGWVFWPLALAVHLWFLKRNDKPGLESGFKLLHTGWVWLVVLLVWAETSWRYVHHFPIPEGMAVLTWETWSVFTTGLFPIFVLFLVSFLGKRLPFSRHLQVYLHWGLAPIVLYLLVWLMQSFSVTAEISGIPYIPIFNPLELLQAFFLLSLVAWLRKTEWRRGAPLRVVLGVLAFLWVNTLLARTVSYWSQVPYYLADLLDSLVFQTALTIYWTILAMSMMVLGTRKRLRTAWMIGATLLGATVLKMFLIDLSKTQTVARVVSFLGAGVLILLIGYFSPLPPKSQKEGPL